MDDYSIKKYLYDQAKVNTEKSTLFDKTIGTPIRALKDLTSPITMDESSYIKDDKGNKVFIPTYNELKQEKVRNDTKGLLGFGQDIVYSGTKILGASALDAATLGVGGKALYWTDMATDNYKNVINQGYSKEQAFLNAAINTGSEFLTEKLLGGFSGKLTGGEASQLENVFANKLTKLTRNPKISRLIGSMGSEGVEEFTQEFLSALNDKITLGEDKDIDKLVEDAFYSGLIGAGTSGLVNVASGNREGKSTQLNTDYINSRIDKMESLKENATGENIKNKLDETINKAQEYVNAPFGKDVNKVNQELDTSAREISPMLKAEETAKIRQIQENNINILPQAEKAVEQPKTIEKTIPQQVTTKTVDTVPEGWIKTEGATAAPKGYTWYNNGKSRFGGEYQNVLVKDTATQPGTQEAAQKITPQQSLADVRNFEDMGNKKINAYQYDNPEVKPYFQQTAKEMLTDLKDATKAERYMTEEGEFGGVKRNVVSDIAELLDGENGVKYSYKQIEDGLNAIIEDNGAENKAVAKRLEFYLDQRLRNGYKDSLGYDIPANKDYISMLENNQKNTQYKERLLRITKNMAEGTELSKEQFLNKWYDKKTYDELGVSKSEIENIYDNANKKVKTTNLAEKKENNVITVKNKSGKELKLKKNSDNTYTKEIPKGNNQLIPKETLENQVIKLKNGTELSNLYSNMTDKSKFITLENQEKLSKEEFFNYIPQSNEETVNNALNKIGNTQKSLENAYGEFLSKSSNFTPEDVAQGWIFLKRFQDAGNYEAMVQVAKKMRHIATLSGQTVQMFNLQSRLTPEGMVQYAQSELMDAEKEFNKGKSKKQIEKYAENFELTSEEVNYIQNQMKKIQNMEDGYAKKVEMAKINKMLQDKLPPEKGNALKSWMRISMLFNPKTQVRNVVGNALITPVNALADVFGAIADERIAKKTGIRTLGAPTIKGAVEYLKGSKKGAAEATTDYKLGINTKDVEMDRFDIGQNKPFNEKHTGLAKVLNPISKTGNKINDLLGYMMDVGDRIFYEGVYNSSLYNQMKLNDVKTPTQEMIDIATQEALSRTWNDSNDYTRFVLNTRRALNKVNVKGYGLGDVLIPFAKTPANLTKAIVDYSPVGLASSIFKTKDIKNAIETGQITPELQHTFAQNLGKGLAGTMLYVLGYSLAKAGITTGANDDDKDVANFMKNTMGIQPYSIKIGDKSYTYDWAQPVAAPFAITANAQKKLESSADKNLATKVFNTIMGVGSTGIDVLLEQSFFQSISEVLNDSESVVNGIQQQVLDLPSRAIPTFLKQINDMIDTTQRTSFEKNQPLTTSKQKAESKIPGLSKNLAPSVDTLGNEIQKYGGDKDSVTYFLKVFLSPSNTSSAKTSKASNEIYRVYKSTGDKNIMPRVAPYSITNKEIGTKDLTSKERATYQKTSGNIINEAMVDLINDKEYKKLSDDKKAEVITKIVGYADAKAKSKLTGKISTYYSTADKKVNEGMAISDYYLSKVK